MLGTMKHDSKTFQLHPERYTDSQWEAIVNRILESLGLEADQHMIIHMIIEERMISAATAIATHFLPLFLPKASLYSSVSSSMIETTTSTTATGGGLSGGKHIDAYRLAWS
jgi:hypothetical protein